MSEPAGAADEPEGGPRERRDPAAAASLLRERIYAILTGLSTVLVLFAEADRVSAGSAAVSVALTMGGLFAASVVADLTAHSAVHGAPASRSTRREIATVSAQALETAVLPVLVIALAGTGIWTLRAGLVIATAVLLLTLGAIALWAVRHSTLTRGRRLLVVVGEMLLGALVIAIKLAAH